MNSSYRILAMLCLLLGTPHLIAQIAAQNFTASDRIVSPMPEDPLDDQQWPTGDVLYSPPKTPALSLPQGAAQITIPARLEWAKLPPGVYASAVTTAREAMRLVQGPMTEQETQRFEDKWAPYYDYPSEEIVSYLNKLSPLLCAFIETRGAFDVASQAFSTAMREALAADTVGDKTVAESAIAAARSHKELMDGCEARLAGIAAEIQSLGPMPNPFAVRKAHRNRFDEEVAAVRKMIEEDSGDLYWVLCKVSRFVTSVAPQIPGLDQVSLDGTDGHAAGRFTRTGEVGQPQANTTSLPEQDGRDDGQPEMITSVDARDSGRDEPTTERPFLISLACMHKWTPMPVLVRAGREDELTVEVTVDSRCTQYKWDFPWPREAVIRDMAAARTVAERVMLPYYTQMSGISSLDTAGIVRVSTLGPSGPGTSKSTEHRVGFEEVPVAKTYTLVSQRRSIPHTETGFTFAIGDETIVVPDRTYYELATSDVVSVHVTTPAGSVEFQYEYQLHRLSPEQVAELRSYSVEKLAQWETARREAAARAEEDLMSVDPLEWRTKEVTFQRDLAAHFGRQRDQAAAQLEAVQRRMQARGANPPADPKLRAQFLGDHEADASAGREAAAALMCFEANMQAAEDRIVYVETGEFVRTRTLYDAYTFHRMAQIRDERIAKSMQPIAIRNAAMRQIEILPPEQRWRLKEQWDLRMGSQSLMDQDVSKLREAYAAICEGVRQYGEQVADQAESRAFNYHIATGAAIVTEVIAGAVFVGVGGSGLTAMEVGTVKVWAGEMLLGMAYGGATGYIEGGCAEALKRSQQWAGSIGYVSSEALDGWAESGTAYGAAERAGKAVAIQLGMLAATRALFGPSGAQGAGAGADDAERMAQLQRDMEAGQQLIKNAEAAEWKLAEAINQGAAMETVEQLTDDVERAAAAVNASWHAKFALKLRGPKSIAGATFDHRIGQVYDKTVPEFIEELKRLGYDVSNLSFLPMRNPSSAGTVSMDLDLALDESQGAITILKDGQPVSRGIFQDEAQQALNRVYAARTGQSAEKSLINLTTLKHREAYSMKLLQRCPQLGALTPAEVAQAADVFRVKVSDMGEQLEGLALFVETSRGMEKEMRTKFLPYLKDQIARARIRGESQQVAKLEQSLQYWEGIYGVFEQIGKRPNNPQQLCELERRLQLATGRQTVWEIADQCGAFWEGLAKFQAKRFKAG